MKRPIPLLLILLAGISCRVHAQTTPPLKLLQKIPMPNVQARLDHSAVDLKNQRLFVAAPAGEKDDAAVLVFEPQK